MPMLSISDVNLVGRNDVADFALDAGKPHFRLFNAGACRTARVQPHLAGVHGREEILAHQPDQARARQ